MIHSFEWSFPTQIIFGIGERQKLKKHVRSFGKKIFIVTSPSFAGERKFILDEICSQISESSCSFEVFTEIEPNPRTTTIDRAAAMARSFEPQAILALGGGSVMDAAKCIAALAKEDGLCFDFAYKGPGQPRKIIQRALPLICIPTVAATGSEANYYAVVTEPATVTSKAIKTTVFGKPLQPALSIIDPELTFSVSPNQTIDGAMDIITHCLETYLSQSDPTPLQDGFTETIVSTVIENLPKVLSDPNDAAARSNLSWCSSLALSGVLSGRDGAWPIHALEHGLSAATDMAHGRGLALLLPAIMKWDAPYNARKILRLNRNLFSVHSSDPFESLEHGLFRFFKSVGAWVTFENQGYTSSSQPSVNQIIEKTLDHVFEIDAVFSRKSPEPYLNNIQVLTRKEAKTLLDSRIR